MNIQDIHESNLGDLDEHENERKKHHASTLESLKHGITKVLDLPKQVTHYPA